MVIHQQQREREMYEASVAHADEPDETTLWKMQAFVYSHFAETGRSPSVQDAADGLGLSAINVEQFYCSLHERHAFYMQPGSEPPSVLMANPFSAVETGFHVRTNGVDYRANCAWDAFGISAALGSDAEIEALMSDSGETVRLAVAEGQALGYGAASAAVVHILPPFARWYDDLVFT